MSHLATRVYTVLKEERPYQLRDPEGNLVTMVEARSLVRERFRVPEEVRRLRRHQNWPKKKENLAEEVPFPSLGRSRETATYQAANAPQRGLPATAQNQNSKLAAAAQSGAFTP